MNEIEIKKELEEKIINSILKDIKDGYAIGYIELKLKNGTYLL